MLRVARSVQGEVRILTGGMFSIERARKHCIWVNSHIAAAEPV